MVKVEVKIMVAIQRSGSFETKTKHSFPKHDIVKAKNSELSLDISDVSSSLLDGATFTPTIFNFGHYNIEHVDNNASDTDPEMPEMIRVN